ncbi:MAG: hypothetical protein ACRBBN_07135 [Methyloligellaceae bacterium]
MEGFSYNYQDWGECLPKGLRYRAFRNHKSCLRFIQRQIEDIDVYSKYMDQYPAVQYEKLEFFYECYRGTCALDDKLLSDYLVSGKTRGWGLWLVLISPRIKPSYKELISEYIEKKYITPDPDDLIDTVFSFYSGNGDDEIISIANKFRSYISQLPKIEVLLREWPSMESQGYIEKYKSIVGDIYKTEGTDAALEYISKNRPEWLMSYKKWLKHKTD